MSRPTTSNTCVTTTAMPRPELLKQTYESFQKGMPWFDFKKMTLYLNIDMFPNTQGKDKVPEILDIARSIFGTVICRNEIEALSTIPSFPAAIKWLFTKADSEFVFHLEDDWLLLEEVPENIFSYFENNPNLMQIGLRAWKLSEPRFVLSPNIMRSSFCNLVAKDMVMHKNPEQQIRGINPYPPAQSFLYWPFEEKVILQDTGRSWMKNTSFARGDGDDFTKWKIVQNPLALKREQYLWDQNEQIDWTKIRK